MSTASDVKPAEYDLIIARGETYTRTFTWTSGGSPVNLTSYHAAMQIRPDWLVAGETPGTPDVDLDDQTKGGITLGGSAGTVTVTIPAAVTAALAIDRGKYDLELTAPSGAVTKFLRGSVTILGEVTV